MPKFSTPFTAKKNDRQLTHEELVRTIRFSIAAEFEAIQIYQQLAESTDDAVTKAVLIDVANEEKEHVGEFLELLHHLCPDEKKYYENGFKEVREIIEELNKS